MVVGSSQQETLDLGFVLFGTRQQGVSVILRGLMPPDGLDPVSPSSAFNDITIRDKKDLETELYNKTIKGMK
ncbi:unnamed protein product [Schistosoma margrebowiei]|uniref:Uncharacterized protein n=1 Tax=Schistosoma margrebowiei TaxID=48269 RepID=A0A183MNS1_9TREM|nr:unnamed protein product [Schistosoma margrebowiei]